MHRRRFLGVLGGTAGLAAAGCAGLNSPKARGAGPTSTTSLVRPGLRPDMSRPAGADLIPEIEHVVVVMMENHSFDNMLGMLGHGDGFTIGSNGLPTNSNPEPGGGELTAFHMPTPCQFSGKPTQTWDASHIQFDNGKNDGFVRSASGDVAMGYFTKADMPFTNSLAGVFPLADRWFCSVLAQTNPNRRYLLAGTSLGLVDDAILLPLPPHGTILHQFHAHGISWKNYYSNLPSILVWPGLLSHSWVSPGMTPVAHFFEDARAGTLPAFSLVDPNFSHSSEENPQDVQFGDVFLSEVVEAVLHGPSWPKTLLIWTYDEHGGYYDHVPPPPAHPPDDVPPHLAGTGQSYPAKFNRFGFRVPSGLVSPYAKPGYVSHTVYDHTSVLKLCEEKWNLPALTRRDLFANSPLDMIDLGKPPAFATPPKLAAPADPALRDSCLKTGPGTIP